MHIEQVELTATASARNLADVSLGTVNLHIIYYVKRSSYENLFIFTICRMTNNELQPEKYVLLQLSIIPPGEKIL